MVNESSNNASLEAQDFAHSSASLTVMECLSQFKNHLEDLVETTENLREKVLILKDREASGTQLRQELHQERVINQSLEQELHSVNLKLE